MRRKDYENQKIDCTYGSCPAGDERHDGCGSQETETTAATTAETTTETETTTAGETTTEAETTTAEAAEEALSGSISMSGSTSMEKVANALRESFMEKYPDVSVSVEFTGSSAGVERRAFRHQRHRKLFQKLNG